MITPAFSVAKGVKRTANKFRRRNRQAGDNGIGLSPALPGAVQTTHEIRNPTGAQFNHAAAQLRETVENPVQRQGAEEILRRKRKRKEILRTKVLPAPQPVLGRGWPFWW